MGKREFITGSVVVLAMAVGFGGMVATRLRNASNKSPQSADDQGVKDALAAFRSEKNDGFPSKSSLMDFSGSATPASAPPAPPATADANSAPSPADNAAQPGTAPATADPGLQAGPPSSPPPWAGANLNGNRYGSAPAADPMTSGAAVSQPAGPTTANPMTAGIDSNTPPAAADPSTPPSGSDPFNRSTLGAATLGLPSEQGASPSDATAAASAAAGSAGVGGAGTALPQSNDSSVGLANSANSPAPVQQADPTGTPGMMPLQPQPLPAAVAAVATPPAESDSRYNNDYRRRDYRDAASDSNSIPPATSGSAGAQAQYQYVSPAPAASVGPPPAGRGQYDVYGREVNRDPDPTTSDTSTQPPANPSPSSQAPYNQPPPPPAIADAWPGNQPRGPREGEPETYTLGPNENYWTISEKVYGTSAFFKAIEEHNRERYPYSDQLRVGDVISTPPVNVLLEKYPDLCPKQRQSAAAQGTALQVGMRGQMGGRIYKVQKGDTLFDIARDELGKASRWAEIYELNRDTIGNNVDMLSPGLELRLPGDRAAPRSDPLTTQSRPPYNR